MPEPFSILVVCTANVCRSPLAEAVLATTFANAAQEGRIPAHLIAVHSAGTQAEPGDPMCAQSAARIHDVPQEHRAQQISPDLLAGADLVLGLDKGHTGACAREWPRCRPHLFTLRQAAMLAAQIAETLEAGELPEGAQPLPADPTDRLRWLTAELDAARGSLAGMPEGSLDIEDTHGFADHGETLADVEVTAGTLARAILDIITPS